MTAAPAGAAPGWYSPVNVTPVDSVAYDPQVDTDSSGRATAVWIRFSGQTARVHGALRQAGALSFQATQSISPSNESADEPHVAVGDGGQALAVWTRSDDGVIFSAYRASAGAVFGSPVPVSATGAYSPRVAMDPQGNAHVVWVRFAGTTTVIEASTRLAGGTFSIPETISDPAFNSDQADVEAEGGVNATAVLTRFNGVSEVQTTERRELNYPRPGGGSPIRVPLVPSFAGCSAANSMHIAPLDQPSCSPPAAESGLLTAGTTGAGSSFARFIAIAGDGMTQANDADVRVAATASDVRCRIVSTGCAAVGDDYTGDVILAVALRSTDLSNGIFADDPGTVEDFVLSMPVPCITNPLATVGSSCNVSTTTNTITPDYVRERKRTVMSAGSVEVTDLGPDGSATPPSPPAGLGCPPECGSGDEATFLQQGLFVP
jgi:hypothetical protein